MLSRNSLKGGSSSSDPTNANDMDTINIKENPIAIPMRNMGPSGRMPATVTRAGALDLGCFFSGFVPPNLACLDDALLPASDGARTRPVVERKEWRVDILHTEACNGCMRERATADLASGEPKYTSYMQCCAHRSEEYLWLPLRAAFEPVQEASASPAKPFL